ncbi:class I SAM-dependent methyltransferase [Candidatus Desantisbacteria bacterium]|nr:class I SAM-dependent methyltransferase [Candidatus Desantisbacteria bacterium]
MSKQGEIDYLKNIGEAGILHALNKPFSDAYCGEYLVQIGTIMSLLPQPPAKLLDLGCGTGWTSCLFAKRGYEVTGSDIADDMIKNANINKNREGLNNLQFIVCDYENLKFDSEFDCAVFFDSLHHSMDENDAILAVYKALKHGGVCIAFEPGTGNENRKESKDAVLKYKVNERDMPPKKIIKAGKKAGFRVFKTYPHIKLINRALFAEPKHIILKKLFKFNFIRNLAAIYIITFFKRYTGIVLMVK